jgi:hypothetical protein
MMRRTTHEELTCRECGRAVFVGFVMDGGARLFDAQETVTASAFVAVPWRSALRCGGSAANITTAPGTCAQGRSSTD